MIRAPAGAGKTVLLAEWAQASTDPTPRAWLTLSPSTGERLAFWQAVAELLRDAGIVGAEPMFSAAAGEKTPDLRRELQRGFAEISAGLVLILDDFHHAADPEISTDIAWLVQHVTRLRVITSSRTESTFENSTSRARVDTFVLPPTELMFTAGETAEAVKNAGVDPRLVPDIHTAAGANPLAVRALILNIAQHPIPLDDPMNANRLVHLAAGTLRKHVIDSIEDPRTLDAAIRVSIADSVTEELARRLTGWEDGFRLLLATESAGLGMSTDDGHSRTFRFTALVHDSLRAKLRKRFPDELPQLSHILITWLLENGQGFAALSKATEFRNYELASLAARQHFFTLTRSNPAGIVRILAPVSRSILRRQPLLAMILAVTYNSRDEHRTQALEYFNLAVQGARTAFKTSDPTERVILLAVETIALRVSGKIDDARTAAQKLITSHHGLTVQQRESLTDMLPQLFDQAGLSFLYSGDFECAIDAFERAFTLSKSLSAGYPHHSLALMAGTLAIKGEITDVRPLSDQLKALTWPDGWRDDYIGSFFHLAEAFLALEDFDLDTAEEHLQVMSPHLRTLEHWPLFAHVKAMVDLGRGRSSQSDFVLKRELRKARRASITPFTRARLEVTRSVLLLASGRATEADSLLRRAAEHPPVSLGRARVALISGEPEEAVSRLAPLDVEALSPRLASEAQLLRSAAELRLGYTNLARDTVESAAAIMFDRGLRHPLMLTPRGDRSELAKIVSSPATAALLTDSRIPDVLPSNSFVITLTEREHEVLQHLATGRSAADIAAALFVSVNTLKTHQRSLYRKLGVSSRKEAMATALKHNMIDSRRGDGFDNRPGLDDL